MNKKPAGNPKLGATDPSTIRAVAEAKRAEANARLVNAKALDTETAAQQRNARATGQNANATRQLADTTEDFAENADEAAEAGGRAAAANKRGASAFEKLESAAAGATRGIEGVEAAYKLYIAANYDAIHAATMSMRMMQKEIPKSAQAAGSQIDKLTGHFVKLREQSTKMATKFIVPWQQSVADMDTLLEAFGTNMNDAGDGIEERLTSLQRRMYATREITGQSFEDQLKNIDDGITHLGLSAEAYQDQIEIMAKAPELISDSLKGSVELAARYKDILKTNGVIRAVQDMIKALDMENVSVKRLAATYGVMIEQSIKYGRSQKAAIAYSEKMTEALSGVGDQTDLFQVPNFLAGLKMMGNLNQGGLGQGGKADTEARAGFFEDLGVQEKDASDKQREQVDQKMANLLDVLKGGEANAGAIGQFAPTRMRQHAKLQSLGDYEGLASGDVQLPGVQVALQQILGAKNIEGGDAQQFKTMVATSGGGVEGLEKAFDDFQKIVEERNKQNGGEGELQGAEKVAQERLKAEAPNVVMNNLLGPNSLIVDALKDAAKSLTSIEGAVGLIAGSALFTGGAGMVSADKTVQGQLAANKAAGTTQSGQSAGDLSTKLLSGTATPQEMSDAEKLSKQMHARGQQQADQTTAQKAYSGAVNAGKEGIGGVFEGKRPASILDYIPQYALVKGAAAGAATAYQTDTNTGGQQTETEAQKLDYALRNKGAGKPAGHRSGISNIPYDDYLAQLHEGEAVLTKQQNRTLRDAVLRAPQPTAQRSGGSATGGGDNNQSVMNGNMIMDAKIVGDKLVFTVNDAGSTIAQLLLQARNADIT